MVSRGSKDAHVLDDSVVCSPRQAVATGQMRLRTMTSRNIAGTIKKTKRWIVTIFSCFGFLLLIHGLSYRTGAHLMPSSYSLVNNLSASSLVSSSRMRRHVLSSINNGTDASLMSSVNVHFWDFICGYSVENLRSHPLFPFAPFRRDEANRLHLAEKDIQFGARMFGFIHPPRTGFYVFALSSDDASELWLSPGADPLHVQLIASVGGDTGKEWSYENQYDKYATQMSKEIELEEGVKYYFDALWKQERARGHIQVAWKLPDGSRFEVVGSRHISRFYDDSHIESGLVYLDHLKGDIQLSDLPSHVKQQEKQQLKYLQERKTLYERDSSEFLSLPIIDFAAISDVLPSCNYYPSWIIEPNSEKAAKLGQYEGVHLPHYYNISTSVYPQDQTWSHTKECVGVSLKPMHCQGNDVLSEQVATWVMNKYMTALSKRFPGRYVLHTLVNVEEAKDSPNGDRYLLEAALEDTVDKAVVRLSVYLYRPEHGTRLCYPKDFQWKKDAMVHFILTVKNQGPWVQQYIESLSKIVVLTKEQRFSLILTDFESFDTDIEGILRRSPIPNWKIIRKNGRFHKTSAIQEAVDSITDPNSIALQTDLHLEFPLNFIDDTRKHCVQGKMGYTPLLMRLACGRYSHEPAGFWEAFGYGIFAIYKSDWDHMGGMDVEKFRNAWGGEDWDFADRVIKSGIEIERLRVPYFFHFYHTKKGMWDNKY